MKVKILEWVVYEKDGWTWKSVEKYNPSWAEIEASIRRLDQFCFPFVWLKLADDDEEGFLNVVGGNGIYAIEGYTEEEGQRRYWNENHSTTRIIKVWLSDQGFETEELYVCYDIDIVLKVARYFAEHGALDPTINWDY